MTRYHIGLESVTSAVVLSEGIQVTHQRTQAEVIQMIYGAALDPSLWEPVMRKVTQAVGCNQSMLALRLPSPDHPGAVLMTDIDERATEEFPHYFSRFPQMVHNFMHSEVGKPFELRRVIGRTVIEASEFYNDWAAPLGQFDGFAAKVFQEGPDASMLVIATSVEKPKLTHREQRFLVRLIPHFETALKVLRRIEWNDLRYKERGNILDRLTIGIITVDSNGRFIDANRAGWLILEAPDGLTIRHGSVVTSHHSEYQRLRELIASAAQTSEGDSASPGGTLSLSRCVGKRPLSVTVSPVARDSASFLGDRRSTVALFVIDPEDSDPSFRDRIAAALPITSRQADIAIGLIHGRSLEEVAEDLQITVGTARNYLKDLFVRTGTRRQAELVSLVLRSVAPFND